MYSFSQSLISAIFLSEYEFVIILMILWSKARERDILEDRFCNISIHLPELLQVIYDISDDEHTSMIAVD